MIEYKQVWYCEGDLHIIDQVNDEGLSAISLETEAEIKKRYPNAKKMDWDDALERINKIAEQKYINEPIEITEDDYLYWLNVMPPMNLVSGYNETTFKMGEMLYANYTRILAQIGDKYFTFTDQKSITHQEIIAKCKGV